MALRRDSSWGRRDHRDCGMGDAPGHGTPSSAAGHGIRLVTYACGRACACTARAEVSRADGAAARRRRCRTAANCTVHRHTEAQAAGEDCGAGEAGDVAKACGVAEANDISEANDIEADGRRASRAQGRAVAYARSGCRAFN